MKFRTKKVILNFPHWVQDQIILHLFSIPVFHRLIWALAGRILAVSIIPFMTRTRITNVLKILILPTALLAETAGTITLRLANADILPFEFKNWYRTVSGYLDEIIKETETMRKETEKHNKLVAENAYALAADPKETFVKPIKEVEVPYLDFAPLQNVLAKLKETTDAFNIATLEKLPQGKRKSQSEVNEAGSGFNGRRRPAKKTLV